MEKYAWQLLAPFKKYQSCPTLIIKSPFEKLTQFLLNNHILKTSGLKIVVFFLRLVGKGEGERVSLYMNLQSTPS